MIVSLNNLDLKLFRYEFLSYLLTCSLSKHLQKSSLLLFTRIAYLKHSKNEVTTAKVSERLNLTLFTENLKNKFLIKVGIKQI